MNASNELSGPNYNMEQGIEFEKVENARMLTSMNLLIIQS